MKLSIITPYYKTLEQTKKLANRLEPQLTSQVEWIIVDDGCNEQELDKIKARVIHLEENSGGASVPRNIGLDIATGEYIAFIDSDDMVSADYIEKILNKTKEEWDYCYISWQQNNIACLIKDEPPSWNCCIWNCIYKKELIGDTRFNPQLKKAEDWEFNKKVKKGKKAIIPNVLYTYNNTDGSLSKQKDTYNDKYR